MRLATFMAWNGEAVIGCVGGAAQSILDLPAAHRALFGGDSPALADMLSLMDGGDAALELVRRIVDRSIGESAHRYPLASVRLLPPVPEPRQIRRFTRTKAAGKEPICYLSNRFNVVGQDAEIEWPSYSQRLDYEAQLGVFIGREGKNIPKRRAAEHIFGYAIFNDFTAREAQARDLEGRAAPAKSFDTGNAVGPWIVTRDEIPDVRALSVTVHVNGELWSKHTTAGMAHGFDEMIAFASQDETLRVGEFLASGAIGGRREPKSDRWLKDGDVIAVEMEKLGVLRNRVLRSSAARRYQRG